MRSLFLAIVGAILIALGAAREAAAAPVIERQGSENPVSEVAKSTIFGALGGLALGGAIALVSNGNNDGDIVKWGFVSGTFIGFGYGIYHVATRPKTTALLELRDGVPSLHAAMPEPEPGRGMALRLVSATF
jgi:hypothetical protein